MKISASTGARCAWSWHQQAHVVITVLLLRSSAPALVVYALTVRVALAEEPNGALEAVRQNDVVGYSGLALDARRCEEPARITSPRATRAMSRLISSWAGYMRGGVAHLSMSTLPRWCSGRARRGTRRLSSSGRV